MLETHCTNPECPEALVIKEVPEDLADAAITCGQCGEPTTPPAATTAAAGTKAAP